MDGGTRAAQALTDSGIEHTITRHGKVGSLESSGWSRAQLVVTGRRREMSAQAAQVSCGMTPTRMR